MMHELVLEVLVLLWTKYNRFTLRSKQFKFSFYPQSIAADPKKFVVFDEV